MVTRRSGPFSHYPGEPKLPSALTARDSAYLDNLRYDHQNGTVRWPREAFSDRYRDHNPLTRKAPALATFLDELPRRIWGQEYDVSVLHGLEDSLEKAGGHAADAQLVLSDPAVLTYLGQPKDYVRYNHRSEYDGTRAVATAGDEAQASEAPRLDEVLSGYPAAIGDAVRKVIFIRDDARSSFDRERAVLRTLAGKFEVPGRRPEVALASAQKVLAEPVVRRWLKLDGHPPTLSQLQATEGAFELYPGVLGKFLNR